MLRLLHIITFFGLSFCPIIATQSDPYFQSLSSSDIEYTRTIWSNQIGHIGIHTNEQHQIIQILPNSLYFGIINYGNKYMKRDK